MKKNYDALKSLILMLQTVQYYNTAAINLAFCASFKVKLNTIDSTVLFRALQTQISAWLIFHFVCQKHKFQGVVFCFVKNTSFSVVSISFRTLKTQVSAWVIFHFVR